ncbi:MAG: alginate O-acetyltransferase [Moraxellaceae bacterium]|nr:alginate O-acetyltransferase [Moraxellaceae bacterium]
MEMESASVVLGSKEEGGASLVPMLVSANAVLWLALLVLSFLLTIPVALRYEKSSSLTLVDGKLAADFEKHVAKHHPYSERSLNSWAALELAVLGSGKPGVVIGDDGWLFTNEEFPLPSQRAKTLEKNLAQIRSTVEALRAKGLEVVILPIPGKAEVYRDKVPAELRGHILPTSAVTGYLTHHGIPWVGLDEDLQQARARGQDTFFRSETHWTPTGSRIAAAAVARWAQTDGHVRWEARPYTVQPVKAQPLESDLENYVPVRPTFAGLLPPPESYTSYVVSSAATANDAGALFGDAGNPVALVGTSYSADERWNFTGWLRSSLQTEIDNISEKGKGPFAPMEKFLEKLEAGKTAPRLVIWEMPVRSVAMDYTPRKSYFAQ